MTKADTPRLAIIGCGSATAHYLLPSLLRIGWRPTVLVDRSRARCERLMPQLGPRALVAVASDWTEVEGLFDAAIVATPAAARGPIGNALAGRGIHLYVENPLASTLAQAEQLVATADEQARVLVAGLPRRYLTIARWTKALLASDILGRIERFEAREGSVYGWATNSPGKHDSHASGSGVLTEIGTHALDLLLWWFGEVHKATHHGDFQAGAAAGCRIDLLMESGVIGSLDLSRGRNLRNTVRIVGGAGYVEVHVYANEVVAGSSRALDFVFEGVSPRTMQAQICPDLYDAALRDFRKAIVEGGPPAAGARESLRSLALIERRSTSYAPFARPLIAPEPKIDSAGCRLGSMLWSDRSEFRAGGLTEHFGLDNSPVGRCIAPGLA